jgi:hypothetical protein
VSYHYPRLQKTRDAAAGPGEQLTALALDDQPRDVALPDAAAVLDADPEAAPASRRCRSPIAGMRVDETGANAPRRASDASTR